jgi:hypothetical protein
MNEGTAAPPQGVAPGEEVLISLPTWGFGVAFGPPSLWTWSRWNLIQIVLTSQRLYGVWNPSRSRMLFSRKRGKVHFEVPLATIKDVSIGRVGMIRTVTLRYEAEKELKQLTIEGSLLRTDQIQQLHDMLQRRFSAH